MWIVERGVAVKFRKKPIIVEAVQWTYEKGFKEKPEWLTNAISDGVLIRNEYSCSTPARELHSEAWCVDTLEGVMRIGNKAWVIRGVNGELYPCDDEVFKKTYEVAEGDLE